ncbi:4'-phosphopantetheinyl transferase [Dyella sp. OK004]|uniref:4'-phosphopantetheinyl transferase family protein n=1 Tax=Dyella sp. OK004 TaxID=1855292 RepID=UPI0008EC7483|nr:4'-phosphopantetheinyl transferase superfamily protein [Dyella sp. OK004]SFS17069.1 4'-phosphopantetheinyl transferase [Dyella sp. OK004]
MYEYKPPPPNEHLGRIIDAMIGASATAAPADTAVTPWHFEHAADLAIARVAFTAPAEGEARVLVFDSIHWRAHTAAAHALLDSRERMRAARFRHGHDYVTYVLAHAMWRLLLSLCLDVDPADVPLTNTPIGQPLLPGTDFATSLSHSGRWVAVAIANARSIGVDIERTFSTLTLDDLLTSVCTPTEARELRELPRRERERALLQLWTRKEAALKAFGVGLTLAPSTFPITTNTPITPPLSAAAQPPCRVRDLELPPGLVGAVAMPIAVQRLEVHVLEEM